jgi:ethanolamine utilization protein EutQ
MATLITVDDIQEFVKQGRRLIRIDGKTLITPSAKDAAGDAGIEIEYGFGEPQNIGAGLDPDLIYRALSAMEKKGLLEGVDIGGVCQPCSEPAPYAAESDPSGLKIVKDGSVRMEYLDTGNPDNKVHYQEVICSKTSQVFNAGFLEIDGCTFDWEVGCDEMYYVIAGPLNITVSGKTYTANTGDVVNLPVGHTVVFSAAGKAKMFYGIKAA